MATRGERKTFSTLTVGTSLPFAPRLPAGLPQQQHRRLHRGAPQHPRFQVRPSTKTQGSCTNSRWKASSSYTLLPGGAAAYSCLTRNPSSPPTTLPPSPPSFPICWVRVGLGFGRATRGTAVSAPLASSSLRLTCLSLPHSIPSLLPAPASFLLSPSLLSSLPGRRSHGAKRAAGETSLPDALLHCCAVACTLHAAGDRREAAAAAAASSSNPSGSAASASAGGGGGAFNNAGGGRRPGQGSRAGPAPSSAGAANPAGGRNAGSGGAGADRIANGGGAGGGGGGGGGALSRQLQQALDQRVAVSLSLLKHLAYGGGGGGGPSRQLLCRAGAVEAAWKLWRCVFGPAMLGSGPSSSSSSHKGPGGGSGGGVDAGVAGVGTPAFHEMLGLLTNLVVDCPEARARLAAPAGQLPAEAGGASAASASSSSSSSDQGLLNPLVELLLTVRGEGGFEN
jgi:hypothetical protein